MSTEDPPIIVRDAVTLVMGQMDLGRFASLAKRQPKTATLDPDVARMAGATVAMGLLEDLAALRTALAPEARAAIAANPVFARLSPEAREWLATGRQGTSSQILFRRVTGTAPPGLTDPRLRDHPHDLSDFERCLCLEAAVPEIHAHLWLIRDVSSEWATIHDHWEILKDSFIDEAGLAWSKASRAPKTNELWQSLGFR